VFIKARETEYNGYLFRSRLEARWAVFFDALGIRYMYELETFKFGDGTQYLPDFWMPDQDCWIEIKPFSPTEKEEHKAQLLADATGKRVFIFYGEPRVPDFTDDCDSAWAKWPRCEDDLERARELVANGKVEAVGWGDYGYLWCECRHCGALGIEFDGRSARLPCRKAVCPPPDGHPDKDYNYDSPRLRAAYKKAKQARFEFGATPISAQRKPVSSVLTRV
jgi:hypothetical protein